MKKIDLKKIPSTKFPGERKKISSINKENMEYLNKYFKCESKYHQWEKINGNPLPGSSKFLAARITVVKMLIQAEEMLPENLHFKIYDAYRPIAVQQALWDYFKEEKTKENPNLSDDEINRITSYCVSYPSYDILNPSLHNTGGAIDLTIIDENGIELDMGCGFDDFTEKAWTDYYEKNNIDENIKNNRRLLYNVMLAAGFTNLPSEWWHYDFGDNAWSCIKDTNPIYTGILDAKIKECTDYKDMEKVRDMDTQQQNNLSQNIIIS